MTVVYPWEYWNKVLVTKCSSWCQQTNKKLLPKFHKTGCKFADKYPAIEIQIIWNLSRNELRNLEKSKSKLNYRCLTRRWIRSLRPACSRRIERRSRVDGTRCIHRCSSPNLPPGYRSISGRRGRTWLASELSRKPKGRSRDALGSGDHRPLRCLLANEKKINKIRRLKKLV